MNRRGFVSTLFAPFVARFLPRFKVINPTYTFRHYRVEFYYEQRGDSLVASIEEKSKIEA